MNFSIFYNILLVCIALTTYLEPTLECSGNAICVQLKEYSPSVWWSILRILIAGVLLKFFSHCKDCRVIPAECYKTSHNNWTWKDSTKIIGRLTQYARYQWALATHTFLLNSTIPVHTVWELPLPPHVPVQVYLHKAI